MLSAASGHIAVHEAGAIERGGHKVLALPHEFGKVAAVDVEAALRAWAEDVNRAHMVMPGMLYISQPTEYGTLYSLAELEALSRICRAHHIPLYVDGARLAYALASSKNDVTLADLARLSDVFYIGGTKCGALCGEAVVMPDAALAPHFFTVMKQHGALLAKGRVLFHRPPPRKEPKPCADCLSAVSTRWSFSINRKKLSESRPLCRVSPR